MVKMVEWSTQDQKGRVCNIETYSSETTRDSKSESRDARTMAWDALARACGGPFSRLCEPRVMSGCLDVTRHETYK